MHNSCVESIYESKERSWEPHSYFSAVDTRKETLYSSKFLGQECRFQMLYFRIYIDRNCFTIWIRFDL